MKIKNICTYLHYFLLSVSIDYFNTDIYTVTVKLTFQFCDKHYDLNYYYYLND